MEVLLVPMDGGAGTYSSPLQCPVTRDNNAHFRGWFHGRQDGFSAVQRMRAASAAETFPRNFCKVTFRPAVSFPKLARR
jgi:hypothetical protein